MRMREKRNISLTLQQFRVTVRRAFRACYDKIMSATTKKEKVTKQVRLYPTTPAETAASAA
jgi:hypothetical protein